MSNQQHPCKITQRCDTDKDVKCIKGKKNHNFDITLAKKSLFWSGLVESLQYGQCIIYPFISRSNDIPCPLMHNLNLRQNIYIHHLNLSPKVFYF